MVRPIHRREYLAGSAAVLAGLAGCSGAEMPGVGGGVEEAFPLRMAVLAPQSGSLERFGPTMEDVVTLVERQLNAADADFTLEYDIWDTESDPDTAVDVAHEAVDAGYQAILGPGSGESASAVAQEVLVPESVAAITPLACTGLGTRHEGYIYTTAPRARSLGIALSRPIAMEGIGSASVIYTENAYGQSIENNVEAELVARGVDIHGMLGIDVDPADSYEDELDEALGDDAEALIVASDPGPGIQLAKDFYEYYGDQAFFVTDRLKLPELPDETGDEMENAQAVSMRPRWDRIAAERGEEVEEIEEDEELHEDADLLTYFNEAYQHAYERFPSIQAAQTFDATVVLAFAVAAAGDERYEGDEIRRRIWRVANQQTGIEGIQGYGYDDFWEGIPLLADGVRNNYTGASGTVEFDRDSGWLVSPMLHAAAFDAEHPAGFRELLPIPT